MTEPGTPSPRPNPAVATALLVAGVICAGVSFFLIDGAVARLVVSFVGLALVIGGIILRRRA